MLPVFISYTASERNGVQRLVALFVFLIVFMKLIIKQVQEAMLLDF